MKKVLFMIASAMLLSISNLWAQEKQPLTVVSFNIRYGTAEDGTNSWQFRFPAVLMMLEDQKPDIFGLQEALDMQVSFLKEYLEDYKYVGVGRDNGKSEGEHMAVFYNKKRIKLLKWGTFWLSETPEKVSFGWDAACRRTATWTLLKDKKTGKKFYFVNTHLDHVGVQARKNGLALIAERIKTINQEGLPIILTGDFNSIPSDECLQSLEGKMESARDVAKITDRHGTFNDWGHAKPQPIIDYIYFSGFSECLKFETITKEYDGRSFISDHFPVKAQLKY